MPDPELRSVLVRISGLVQGVGYRAWTADEARRRGLSGWVHNLANGDVEAAFSGPATIVDEMIAACRRGPPSARVDHVMIDASEPTTGPFKVRYEW